MRNIDKLMEAIQMDTGLSTVEVPKEQHNTLGEYDGHPCITDTMVVIAGVYPDQRGATCPKLDDWCRDFALFYGYRITGSFVDAVILESQETMETDHEYQMRQRHGWYNGATIMQIKQSA